MLKNNLKNSKQIIEIVNHFSVGALNEILKLEKECFPAEWQYEDADKYYKKMLGDAENINIFLKDGKRVAGYILARFHNKEIKELSKYDDKFKERKGFYVETIQIFPEFQGIGGAKKLILAVCEEANKRGFDKFSIHARKKNGLNDKIKNIFKDNITDIRNIEKWEPAVGESYEYIEWEYKN
ncbi:MAG: hypothetical protein US30_C0011G0029 [Candidatus Moranbacteria bacterium GW2011_GWF2_36_839]|nr:MAG: hypothetical protein US27_C0011G0016 [Candidatus Moranbacteria bacterium GW2011_GWF1_36_78]KKQ16798.1 MAG: hypothetical protein US30_C0011G0029 [Candidatus Moranbacteria bacterium GW2011_GWF2_36_839]HAT73601.1 hypothetical protein [Candidatus Moranbacteria bacterium]HBY10588.1 hypothetical protein [Candidatus Moranbacteria bacterium]